MRARIAAIWVMAMLISMLTGVLAEAGPAENAVILQDAKEMYKPFAQMEILEDTEGTLNLVDVRSPQYDASFERNRDEVPNSGYTAPVHWVRFQLVNASDERAWLLEMDYPPLDRVDLFMVSGNGTISHKVSGDSLPFSEREVSNRNIAFELMLDRNETAMIYLRVETLGAMALPIQIVHAVKYAQHQQWIYMLLGVYYGLMLIMVIYNSILAFSFRSRAFFSYVGINVSNLLLYTTLNGIAFQYIWPDGMWWNNRAIVFFMCLSHLTAMLFANEFLDLSNRHPKLHRLFRWFAGMEAVNIVVLLISYPAGLYMSIYSVPMIEVSLIVAGLVAIKGRNLPGHFFLLGWGFFMAGALLSTMSDAGYIPMVWWTTYASQIGSTIEAVVLSWGLTHQIQSIRKEKELAVAQMKETGRLADMDDLTGLYNRRYFIRTFEELVQNAEAKPLSLIMLDLDHFKQVNDTFGHDAGDQVLQKLAAVLEECFRPTDIIGRFGGEEFMVLLRNTNAEQARSAAEYVLKSIREQRFRIKDQALTCTVSLGIAQWDEERQEDFKEMLERADQAMYEAKRGGRNQVCMSGVAWRLEV